MLATSRAAGPLSGIALAARWPGPGAPRRALVPAAGAGAGAGALAVRRAPRRVVSPMTPLSNSWRHSGDTPAGFRRNSSYKACANPALAVSKTFESTCGSSASGGQAAGPGARTVREGKITAPMCSASAAGGRRSCLPLHLPVTPPGIP